MEYSVIEYRNNSNKAGVVTVSEIYKAVDGKVLNVKEMERQNRSRQDRGYVVLATANINVYYQFFKNNNGSKKVGNTYLFVYSVKDLISHILNGDVQVSNLSVLKHYFVNESEVNPNVEVANDIEGLRKRVTMLESENNQLKSFINSLFSKVSNGDINVVLTDRDIKGIMSGNFDSVLMLPRTTINMNGKEIDCSLLDLLGMQSLLYKSQSKQLTELKNKVAEQSKVIATTEKPKEQSKNMTHYKGALGEFDYDSSEWEIVESSFVREHLSYKGKKTKGIEIPKGVTDCYAMFWGCVSLVEAPKIPQGVTNCEGMFRCCSSLVNASEIPDSVTNCSHMFDGCSSLVNVPKIPNSVKNCAFMFDGCSSLVNALIILKGVKNCRYMFAGCSLLVNAPEISQGVTNCESMFAGCISLEEAPEIPNSVTNCSFMFSSCSKKVREQGRYNIEHRV